MKTIRMPFILSVLGQVIIGLWLIGSAGSGSCLSNVNVKSGMELAQGGSGEGTEYVEYQPPEIV